MAGLGTPGGGGLFAGKSLAALGGGLVAGGVVGATLVLTGIVDLNGTGEAAGSGSTPWSTMSRPSATPSA